jgi:RND family efflux transporter MFP subunit
MMQIANANLAKSKIKATHYGIVAAKFVETSEFAGPGTPLYKIIDYRKIIVEAQIAESQVALIKKGTTVSVRINALNQNFEGTIDTVIPTADAVSKTFTTRVKIDNSDLAILVGMSARLLIKTKTYKDVLVVPQNAVIEEQGGSRNIFIAQNGKAQKRSVTLGATSKGKVIINEGISAGEKLVIMGQRDLNDGQPVNIF